MPRYRRFWPFTVLFTVLVVQGCAKSLNETNTNMREYSSVGGSSSVPGCKGMVDAYCDTLYSPSAMGNLRIQAGTHSIEILQGHTTNDFPAVYYQYARTTLKNRRYLPQDFRTNLVATGYFEKLSDYLARKPRASMSLADRMNDLHVADELTSEWNSSLETTVVERMSKRFPGFHNLPEPLIPLELKTESRRVRRQIKSEIYLAIWKHHPNWLKVEASFEALRYHYLQTLAELDIPKSLKDEWTHRIQSVRLVLPGAMPEIADEDCSETEINAYYYTYLNVITVCAGDFNSEDIYQTLAHELSHALDFERSLYLYQKHSDFGTALSSLRAEVCEPESFSCDDWVDFKNQFDNRLNGLSNFSAQLPEFQRCLKPRPTPSVLTEEALNRYSDQIVTNRIADLADSEIFLRITKPRIPLMNGTLHKNPNYLNPCSYYLWSKGEEPVDDDLTALMFFTAEYQCNEGKSPANRIQQAIALAKNMQIKVQKAALKMEGEFSSEKLLQTEGYSSSPVERFADVMGGAVLAHLLKDIPSLDDRRNLFLASSSWQCTKPSLAKFFPEESSAEHEFTFASHTEGEDRKKELLPSVIRDTLQCKKDFSFNECSLPVLRNPQPNQLSEFRSQDVFDFPRLVVGVTE